MAHFPELTIGDIQGGNYTRIDKNGIIRRYGQATMWDDLVGSLVARRLTSTAGRLNYDYDENAILMQNAGDISDSADRLIFNHQKAHGAKDDSTFNVHIHFEQVSDNKIEFTLQYRIQNNLAAKTEDWITVVTNTDDHAVLPYPGSGTFNQIVELVQVPWVGCNISSTVQFRLARTDSIAEDILTTFIDGHIERDGDGSDYEYVKWES